MDTDVAEMIATIARIDERQGHIIEKIDNLEQVAMKRLNSHAQDIDSLQQTRDRQRGGSQTGRRLRCGSRRRSGMAQVVELVDV